MLLDLHTHSSESDGSLTPEELCSAAAEQGVSALALCDHDTTQGIARFRLAGKRLGVEVVSGVEISAEWRAGNCHVLGLGVAGDYAPLEKVLKQIRDSRETRNRSIIAKLNSAGVGITPDEVAAIAGGEVVGRPHMARVMVARGFAATVQEAFDKYLAKGAVAYVDRYRLEPPGAVSLLKEAGAAVVLAHPSQLRIAMGKLEVLVEELISQGLDGIEVYSPHASDEQVAEYELLCRRHSLLCAGGSDFHGAGKPEHKLGYYRTDKPIPADKVDLHKILAAAAEGKKGKRYRGVAGR